MRSWEGRSRDERGGRDFRGRGGGRDAGDHQPYNQREPHHHRAGSGFISTLKDNFGFIEPLGGGDNLFFHYNALIGRDRPAKGDEV